MSLSQSGNSFFFPSRPRNGTLFANWPVKKDGGKRRRKKNTFRTAGLRWREGGNDIKSQQKEGGRGEDRRSKQRRIYRRRYIRQKERGGEGGGLPFKKCEWKGEKKRREETLPFGKRKGAHLRNWQPPSPPSPPSF